MPQMQKGSNIIKRWCVLYLEQSSHTQVPLKLTKGKWCSEMGERCAPQKDEQQLRTTTRADEH